MKNIYNKYRWSGIFLYFFIVSCTTKQAFSDQSNPFAIKSHIVVTDLLELDSRYIIYPSAFIKTEGNGKVVVKEPISIIGKSQIFATDLKIEWQPFTISEIYPEWFGAKGYDQNDDTEALKKTFAVAKESYNSINIMISTGIYKISETLEVSCEIGKIKSINILGSSMSSSSEHGSSIMWLGKTKKSMLLIKNVNLSRIENVDFTAHPDFELQNNLELRPNIHQFLIKNCSFAGAQGSESANINLNSKGGDQVSEIIIENCSFRGKMNKDRWLTESGIVGGLGNTLNFYIKNCSFMGYNIGAINIHNSSILVVESSTFAHNDVDIRCLICGTYANSNFSEHSNAFFMSSVSSNVSFTSLSNNYFTGKPKDGYVVRDGAGSLFLLNNNFGGNGYDNEDNKIKWEHQPFNSIYSFGNFFKNVSNGSTPFFNRSNQPKKSDIFSRGDIGGKNSLERSKVPVTKE